MSPAGDAALLAGVGTCYLEMFEAQPHLDVIVVPVGSGTGVAAAGLVARAIAPACRVIAVQSAASEESGGIKAPTAGPNFGDILSSAMNETVQASKHAEAQMVAGVQGTARV